MAIKPIKIDILTNTLNKYTNICNAQSKMNSKPISNHKQTNGFQFLLFEFQYDKIGSRIMYFSGCFLQCIHFQSEQKLFGNKQ